MPSSLEIDQAINKIEKVRALLLDLHLPRSSHDVILDMLDEALAHLQTFKTPW